MKRLGRNKTIVIHNQPLEKEPAILSKKGIASIIGLVTIIIGLIVAIINVYNRGFSDSFTSERMQVVTSVNVTVHSEEAQQNFPHDMMSIVIDERVFIPVEIVTELFEVDVSWDEATNNIYINPRAPEPIYVQAPTPTLPPESPELPTEPPSEPPTETIKRPLRQAALFFDRSPNVDARVNFLDTVRMGNIEYRDVLRIHTIGGGTHFSLHNLEERFRILSGYIGRVDGSSMRNARISFIGDGTLIESFDMRADAMPIPFNIPVEGVAQLRIESVRVELSGSTTYAIYAFLK